MPYRKKYRKCRRKYRKKKRKRSKVLRVPGIIIPDTTYVTLRATTILIGDPGSDQQAYTFSGNGAFNPFLAETPAIS